MDPKNQIDQLIELLERKNLCYRSFHKICADFLDEISTDKTENLEAFQRRRQGIINVLEQLEFEITHWVQGESTSPQQNLDSLITEGVRQTISALFNERDGIIKSILDLDLVILQHIDRIKNDTIRKLQGVKSGRKIGGYRSSLDTVESAEGTNKVFDRKA